MHCFLHHSLCSKFPCPHHTLLFKSILYPFIERHHKQQTYLFLRVTEFKRVWMTGMCLLSSLVRSSRPVEGQKTLPVTGKRFVLGRWHSFRSHPELLQSTHSLKVLWNSMTCPFSSLFAIPHTPHHHGLLGQSFPTCTAALWPESTGCKSLICPDDDRYDRKTTCLWRSLEAGLVKDM